MRNTWIAISLCLGLLGAAGCASEEDREKAELRAQIEAGLVEYEELLERYNALRAELRPGAPPQSNAKASAYQYVLSNDPEPRLLKLNLGQLEGSIEILRAGVARYEEQLATR